MSMFGRQVGQPVPIDAKVSTQLPQNLACSQGTSATPERGATRHTSQQSASGVLTGGGDVVTVAGSATQLRLLLLLIVAIAARTVTRLQSVCVCSDAVTDCSQELQSSVRSGVKSVHASLDPSIVENIHFVLRSSDIQPIGHTSHVIHAVTCYSLQVSQKREHIRVTYFDSGSQSGMVALQSCHVHCFLLCGGSLLILLNAHNSLSTQSNKNKKNFETLRLNLVCHCLSISSLSYSCMSL
jgi:hypothetical protein